MDSYPYIEAGDEITCGLGWSMPRGVPIVEMRPLTEG